MNTGGDAADQMIREGIVIMESSIKLSALAAKNIATLGYALAKENPKVRGRTNLDRLLKEDKELKIFPLKATDIRDFNKLAKQYGILYCAVKEKHGEGELLDIMAKVEDVNKLNRVLESLGYPTPKEISATPKNLQARDRSKSNSPIERAGFEKTNQTPSDDKHSVRKAVQKFLAAAREAKQLKLEPNLSMEQKER